MNAEIQDPTKHPLYRAHHGDMTGWRYLEVGEARTRGDEFDWKEQGEGWSPLMYRIGESYTAEEMNMFTYRRRVAPAEKPVEQKRYVTVVFPGDARNLESFLQFAVDHREGNALLILDGLEDRCKLAIHKAFTGGVV